MLQQGRRAHKCLMWKMLNMAYMDCLMWNVHICIGFGSDVNCSIYIYVCVCVCVCECECVCVCVYVCVCVCDPGPQNQS